MKTQFTFEELSKVFALVAKVESAAKNQVEAKKNYEEKDKAFDAEFSKYGYTFRGAPAELQVMFDEKCAALDAFERSEKKAHKVIKEFAEMVEVNSTIYGEWYETEIAEYIKSKRYFMVANIAEYCKSVAVRATKRLVTE